MTHTRTTALALCTILALALILRLLSLQWNFFPHADVEGDAKTAAAFLATGRFLESPDPASAPSIGHSPVWPLLGGSLTALWDGSSTADTFLAMRILSVASGMGLLILLYAITKKLLGKREALIAMLWASVSSLLIDYSGNGAFYSFQAVLYLLWLLAAFRTPSLKRAFLLGVLTGLAYLVNFQSIVLLPAALALELFQTRKWPLLLNVCMIFVLAVCVASPLLIRSFLIAGDPFAHHLANMTYVLAKAGIQPIIMTGGVPRYASGLSRYGVILSMVLTSWLPNNAFYIARKLFVLTPIAFVFMSYGLVDQWLSPERRRRLLPVFLLFAAHFLISASWPVTKFRFLVPLLPLVFLLSLEQIVHWIPRKNMQALWMALITAGIVLGSTLTYFSVPTHTYYFDGAITTDPFSGRQEWNYLRDNHLLPPSS